jgi:protocatechuate 3,4-dioxygenase beta subunit
MPPRDPGARPQTGTAKLSGRVTAQETGAPLRRASVSITGGDAQLRRVTTTDPEGRYEFVDLPAGRFTVSANKAGFVTLQAGQRRPGEAGRPIVLADGQAVERVDLALPRGSVIAGRVTDEFGEPIASAQVQVQRQQYGPDGQRRLAPVGSGTTNDLGEFRVFGLMPADYVVSAGVRGSIALNVTPNPNDVNEGYPPTYYPGTLSPAEAQTVTVAAGQETSLSFSLLPARMMRVSGVVVDSQGRPAAGSPVTLRSPSGAGFMSLMAGLVAADGTFTITNVTPGEHVIEVRPRPVPGESSEAASMPITVGGGDITGIRLVTSRGATITGRVIFEGSSPRTPPTALTPVLGTAAMRVFAASPDPMQGAILAANDPQNGAIGEDGSFRLDGVTGRVFLQVPLNPSWTLKAITVDGEDATDVPIDVSGRSEVSGVRIVLTDKLTTVAGTVTADRRTVNEYVVIVQPEEALEPVLASRLIRVLRPDTNGRFQVRGLRPGSYVATAVESLEAGRQFVPEFQRQLRERGRSFELMEGGAATVTLELAAGL